MGDISEFRGIIVIGSFIAVMILLFGLIPSGLWASQEDYGRTQEIPDYWEASDIQRFNNTQYFLLNNSVDSTSMQEFGGWYFLQMWYVGGNYTTIARYDKILIFYHAVEDGLFHNDNSRIGYGLYDTQLDEDYDNGGLKNLQYRVEFGSTTEMYHLYSFNETLYDSPSQAWYNDALYVLWGMNFDQMRTGYSAWDLIAMTLFFNYPDMNPILNAIIKIPLWLGMAYIAFILILRAIGAIFGGGA